MALATSNTVRFFHLLVRQVQKSSDSSDALGDQAQPLPAHSLIS